MDSETREVGFDHGRFNDYGGHQSVTKDPVFGIETALELTWPIRDLYVFDPKLNLHIDVFFERVSPVGDQIHLVI